MLNGTLAVLPLVTILLATGYRRSRPAGSSRPSWRADLLFGLMIFGGAFIGLGFNALHSTQAPIGAMEWYKTIGVFISVGCAPLAVFLLLDTALRLTRRWESGRPALKRDS